MIEENDLCLAVAGDGSLRAHVEAIAAKPDCRVTYLGRLSGDDVLRSYLAADLLVLPSLFEPWGLVINEAMACGLPVIVSDRVGCADDLVRPAETGLSSARATRSIWPRRYGCSPEMSLPAAIWGKPPSA